MPEWERKRERERKKEREKEREGYVVSHWYLWFDTACADGLTKGFLLEKRLKEI
jgi:hypothetical protein